MEDNVENNLPEVESVEQTEEVLSDSMRDYVEKDTSLEDEVGQEEAIEADNQDESAQPFAQNFDPNSLPAELLPAYKQMQSDYTRKSMEVAQQRKSIEKYAPIVDYIASNPKLVDRLIAESTQETAQVKQDEYPDDVNEFAKRVKQEAKQEALNEFMSMYQKDKQEQLAEVQFEKEISEAEKLDPRFTSDEEFSEEVALRVANDPEYRDGTKTLIQATQEAVARMDALIKRNVDAEMAKLTQLAKQKRSLRPVGGTTRTVATDNTKINSMRDAVPEEFR
jgi:hypothetical protein